jgi:hypothetical protein
MNLDMLNFNYKEIRLYLHKLIYLKFSIILLLSILFLCQSIHIILVQLKLYMFELKFQLLHTFSIQILKLIMYEVLFINQNLLNLRVQLIAFQILQILAIN